MGLGVLSNLFLARFFFFRKGRLEIKVAMLREILLQGATAFYHGWDHMPEPWCVLQVESADDDAVQAIPMSGCDQAVQCCNPQAVLEEAL